MANLGAKNMEHVGVDRTAIGVRQEHDPNQKPNILLTRLKAALDLNLGGLGQVEAPMLPPFIIEQIRKREEAERRSREQQPRLELPLDVHRPACPRNTDNDTERPERGVVVVDLL
jgi:hypothetical protein